ncbi:hypothetical protein [Eubacterium sp.]|uniref:hypothetical protein n=1 Tax=Eubacterium sp. TaxID=142586 RepID=UPI0039944B64
MSAYEYDGLGNRTKETITTGLIKKKKKEKEYVWDYTEKYPVLLEEKESDGTIVRYTYAGNRERVNADVVAKGDNAKTQIYSLYTDRLGSTRWALDENAEVVAKTEYDAWGKPETETVSSKLNGINNSKSYTGYVYDETTGYWNAGARMYNCADRTYYRGGNSDKALGQWFTTEPPESVAKVRIDTAVKPQWIDTITGELTGESVVDTVYAIKIPKGTTVYTGPVGSQGGAYCGGYNIMQTFIKEPWKLNYQVISNSSLK